MSTSDRSSDVPPEPEVLPGLAAACAPARVPTVVEADRPAGSRPALRTSQAGAAGGAGWAASGRPPVGSGRGGEASDRTVGAEPLRAVDQEGRIETAVLRARAYLLRVAEPPAAATVRFVERLGPVAAAEAIRRGDVPKEVAEETSGRRAADRVDVDLAAAAGCGARLLTPEHPDWPHWPFASFTRTDSDQLVPPLALWVRGRGGLADLTERAVAVVGARAATGYGTHTAADLAAGLVLAGRTVVSGAAIGIDGAAHRGALTAGGPTVAVLACGIDRAYPASHTGLIERIAQHGLVVSEYPPGAVPARHRFLVRNRLIAGLAAGTVVVEAAHRSGAQRTASDARELGTVLMAVPGPVGSAVSAGCHELIRLGALLVTRAAEIAEATGRLGAEPAEEVGRPRRPTDGLDPVQTRVHDALPPRAARAVHWLAEEAGLGVEAVRAALTELERRGLAEYREGRWQRVRGTG